MKTPILAVTFALVLGAGLAAGLPPAQESRGGENPKETTAQTRSRIKLLSKDGHHSEAEQEARRLLATVEAAAGRDSLETAGVLDLLLEVLVAAGKTKEPEAKEVADRALAIMEQRGGPESLELSDSLSGMARLRMARGETLEAKRLLERALALREKLLGPDDVVVAFTLNDLARVMADRGDLAQARSMMERDIRIREKALGLDDPSLAASLTNMASVLRRMGDYAEAVKLYDRSLHVLEKAYGPDHPKVALALNGYANLLSDMDDNTRARLFYERALGIRERLLSPDHPDVAQSVYNLAILMKDMGDYQKARSLHERALSIREKAFGPDHRLVAQSLSGLGTVLRYLPDLPGGQAAFGRALAIREKTLGPEHPSVADTLHNLAQVLWDMGDLAGARSSLERALRIEEQVLGPEHATTAKTASLFGMLLASSGNPDLAKALLERALAAQLRVFGPVHTDVAETLDVLARLQFSIGDTRHALTTSLRAESVAREQFQRTSRGLSEREALRYEVIRITGLDVALSLLAPSERSAETIEDTRHVWSEVVRSRALVLDEMAVRHRASGMNANPNLASLQDAVDVARDDLARLAVRGPDDEHPDSYADEVRKAADAKESAERSLATRSAPFRRSLERSGLGLEEVISSLRDGTALVAYISYNRLRAGTSDPASTGGRRGNQPRRGTPHYLAFALSSRTHQPVAVDLGPTATIDPLIDEWRRQAATAPAAASGAGDAGEARYRKAATLLREAIWDPIARELTGARRVLVVPDGKVSLVNLASLTGPGREYLVESGPVVHYLSAERDMVRGDGAGAAAANLLAFGGPDFDSRAASRGQPDQVAATGLLHGGPAYRGPRAACGDFRSLRFDPLPGSLNEVDEVVSLWTARHAVGAPGERSARKLTGAEAGEAAFKRLAPAHRILHVATHGFFLQDRCESTLEYARTGTRAESGARLSGAAILGDNPLLLTGLALAGANRREESGADVSEEDGILTAEEIAALDLSGVEWAVLSACETGLGKVQSGEGVLGLRRAFETAGAGTLIMSLWAVEDGVTRAWMKRLYEARLSGGSTSEAVSRASLEMLLDRRRRGRSTPLLLGRLRGGGRLALRRS